MSPKLSKRYLTVRNRAIDLKSKAAEIELGCKRGTLVEKRLVQAQAAFLLIGMRQKLLNMPSHAHRLIGVTDVNAVRNILREIALSALNELKDRRRRRLIAAGRRFRPKGCTGG